MKFFWKIYFSFTVLFLLAFGLFGTWMIQMTFQQSYQKALKDGEWDNRMYQLAFETSLSSMNPETLSDNMVQVIRTTVTAMDTVLIPVMSTASTTAARTCSMKETAVRLTERNL